MKLPSLRTQALMFALALGGVGGAFAQTTTTTPGTTVPGTADTTLRTTTRDDSRHFDWGWIGLLGLLGLAGLTRGTRTVATSTDGFATDRVTPRS